MFWDLDMLVAAHGNATAQIREVGERIIDHIIRCWDRVDKLFTYTRNSLKMLRSVWPCRRWGSVLFMHANVETYL